MCSRGARRFAMAVAGSMLSLIAVAGCRYEPSICEESPGSGCGACTAECQNDTPSDPARIAACEDRCRKGKWTFGVPSCTSR